MTKRIIPQKEKELDVLSYMHSLSQDIVSIPEITTVSEWNAYWLKNYCGSIKDSTYSSYESAVKNHIDRVLGKRPLKELTVEDVQLFINSLIIGLQLEEEITSKTIKNIHGILDPFTGTGTFIVQLLRSGLIRPDRLLYKYTNEIHANEIVLLAYYIACVNIEETFHDIAQSAEYVPFEGIVLTDTFAMTERQKQKETEGAAQMIGLFSENSARANRQLDQPITVIIGNPPYSAKQKSGNDNNQNTKYPYLDKLIENSYVSKTSSQLSSGLYDPYIRAFKWATERISSNGVIGFVSNGKYLEGTAMDGFRQCLLEDFTSIYVFNLRGNQYTSGEVSRREGGKIFGSGSRTPVAITILIKKKGVKKDGYVRYYDIGDYLSREQKLNIIAELGDVSSIPWTFITPNADGDWINQRNQTYSAHMLIGDKSKEKQISFFNENYATGLSSSRDVWVISFSEVSAKNNAESMIMFYESERIRCADEIRKLKGQGLLTNDPKSVLSVIGNLICNDKKKIAWTRSLVTRLANGRSVSLMTETRITMYRPYCKKNLVYNREIIESPSCWDSIFPTRETSNLVICTSGKGSSKDFSVIISNCIQDRNMLVASQSFPLYMYDKEGVKEGDAFVGSLFGEASDDSPKYKRRYALSDAALKKFQDMYGSKVTKEDIFYYIYAVLQSKAYIEAYADNLSKEMPRIPMLDGFPEYVRIGRELAALHLNYEKPVEPDSLGLSIEIKKPDYTVTQMKFKKDGKETCKDTIFFNPSITISNIPERAYEYVVNGRSAIEWIMESYRIKTDKDSGITDDPNTYSDAKYIFNLLISVIDVSIKTLDLIDSLPEYKEI